MKDADLRRFWGLTWAGWLNVLLQFTGFRLARGVSAGDPAVIDGQGRVSRGVVRTEHFGTFLSDAPAGSVVTVEIGMRGLGPDDV